MVIALPYWPKCCSDWLLRLGLANYNNRKEHNKTNRNSTGTKRGKTRERRITIESQLILLLNLIG